MAYVHVPCVPFDVIAWCFLIYVARPADYPDACGGGSSPGRLPSEQVHEQAQLQEGPGERLHQ